MASNQGTVEFSVRVARPVHEKLRLLAASELSSINREINIAIRAHLDAAQRARKQ